MDQIHAGGVTKDSHGTGKAVAALSGKAAARRIIYSYVTLLHSAILAAGWEDHVGVYVDLNGRPRVDYVSERSKALFRSDGRHERIREHLQPLATQQVISLPTLLHTMILAAGWENHVKVFVDPDGRPRVDYVNERSRALYQLNGQYEKMQVHLSAIAQQVTNIVAATMAFNGDSSQIPLFLPVCDAVGSQPAPGQRFQ